MNQKVKVPTWGKDHTKKDRTQRRAKDRAKKRDAAAEEPEPRLKRDDLTATQTERMFEDNVRSDRYTEIRDLPQGGFHGTTPRKARAQPGVSDHLKTPLVRRVEQSGDFSKMSRAQIQEHLKGQFQDLFDDQKLGTGYFPEPSSRLQETSEQAPGTQLPSIQQDRSGLSTDNKLIHSLRSKLKEGGAKKINTSDKSGSTSPKRGAPRTHQTSHEGSHPSLNTSSLDPKFNEFIRDSALNIKSRKSSLPAAHFSKKSDPIMNIAKYEMHKIQMGIRKAKQDISLHQSRNVETLETTTRHLSKSSKSKDTSLERGAGNLSKSPSSPTISKSIK